MIYFLILGNMGAYLMSEESLAEQTGILVASVCPMAEDPAHCEEDLNMYWAQIGKDLIS